MRRRSAEGLCLGSRQYTPYGVAEVPIIVDCRADSDGISVQVSRIVRVRRVRSTRPLVVLTEMEIYWMGERGMMSRW